MFGGVLATASNLVFAGEVSGKIMAFDAKSGENLGVSYGHRCLYAAHHLSG